MQPTRRPLAARCSSHLTAIAIASALGGCLAAADPDPGERPSPGAVAQAGPLDPARSVIVQLFEWKWTDVARECETYLGPKGYAAVQISPPNEHAWVTSGDGAPFPWWMRYQPVSYSLDRSRSGTRAEFVSMVNRCKAVGVAIYADAVINHMAPGSGTTSSAGATSWGGGSFPRVPYGIGDFHNPACAITNYGDAGNVQSCSLSGLPDLNTGAAYVRGKLADYLVDLATIGVRGFRVDAAKHISPTDLGAIVDAVNARVAATNRPFWFLEVIGAAGEAVQPGQYFAINGNAVNVTEFGFGPQLFGKFAGGGRLADLRTFGETWGLLPSARAIAFTDNHDFFPGGRVRSQDPVVALQGHASYTFRPRLWAAIDATWYEGGGASLDGGEPSGAMNNSRLGATVSFPMGRHQSLKVAYSSGVSVRTGSDFRTLSVGWQFLRFTRM